MRFFRAQIFTTYKYFEQKMIYNCPFFKKIMFSIAKPIL